jgi:hypothetical protein
MTFIQKGRRRYNMYDFIIHTAAAIPVPCSLFPLLYPLHFFQQLDKSEFACDRTVTIIVLNQTCIIALTFFPYNDRIYIELMFICGAGNKAPCFATYPPVSAQCGLKQF